MQLTKIEFRLIYLFAITCSMNALMIGSISISNYILIVLLIYNFIKYRHNLTFNFKAGSAIFSWLFLISILLSVIFSWSLLPGSWRNNLISCLIKYVLVFGYLFMLQPTSKIPSIRKVFFDGFYIGAIIQMIWGFLQLFMYSVFHIVINQIIFGNLLGETEYSWGSFINGNIIRMTGLGWEPANFALVIVIGYVLSIRERDNALIPLIFIITLLLSTSRSGYVAMIAVLILQLIQKSNNLHIKDQINAYKLISFLLLSLIICFVFIKYNTLMINRFQSIKLQFLDIFNNTSVDSSANIHMSYYADLTKILRNFPIVNWLFGAGYLSTGYYYSIFNAMLLDRLSLIGWNPESDFVTLALGNGMLGLLIFYGGFIKAIWTNKQNYVSLILVAIIVCGFTYLTIRGTWTLIFIVFGMMNLDKRYNVKIN